MVGEKRRSCCLVFKSEHWNLMSIPHGWDHSHVFFFHLTELHFNCVTSAWHKTLNFWQEYGNTAPTNQQISTRNHSTRHKYFGLLYIISTHLICCRMEFFFHMFNETAWNWSRYTFTRFQENTSILNRWRWENDVIVKAVIEKSKKLKHSDMTK